MLAIEFGKKHLSCKEAIAWRESLGPEATQADAYLACERGDWLVWQLGRGPFAKEQADEPLQRAAEHMATRAIRRGQEGLRDIREPWATDWQKWALRWLSGEDRSTEAAKEAATAAMKEADRSERAAAKVAARVAARIVWVTVWATVPQLAPTAWAEDATVDVRDGVEARANEQNLQAQDIRREIPKWLGE